MIAGPPVAAPDIPPEPARRHSVRLHYAWVVLAVAFLALLAGTGVRSTTGVLIKPIEAEFHWSRTVTSGAVSLSLLLFGLGGPFGAALMARFGIRRVLLASLAVLAIGIGLTSLVTQPWQLALSWGALIGIGSASMGTVLSATISNRWFVRRRGLAMGLLTASFATGQVIFLGQLAALVQSRGWRWACYATVLALLAAIGLVAVLMRDDPAAVGQRAYGAPADYRPPPQLSGNAFAIAVRTLGEVITHPDFLRLAGSFFICGATTFGLIATHLIPAAVEHGVPAVTAAWLLATIGIFDIAGTTVSGWLTDRFDSRWLLFCYYTGRGLALLLLPFVLGTSFFGLVLFIVFYGLDWVATVPPTASLTRSSFGAERMPVIFAWVFAAHQMGSAAMALAAGSLRTFFGDYQTAFITGAVLCLVAAGLVLRVGRPRLGAEPPDPVVAPSPGV